MWLVLVASAALAAPPVAVEGGLSISLPHGGLSLAPGVRVLGEVAPVSSLEGLHLGIEADLRLPGGASPTLNDPSVAQPIELRTRQTAWSAGARGSYHLGDPEGLGARGSVALGASRLIESVRSDAGPSRRSASALWLRPELGVVQAVGPGAITASLFYNLAPTQMELSGRTGSTAGLLIGWRQRFGGDATVSPTEE